VSDAGLDHLGNLPGLKHLDLSHTRVTDAGLERLRHMSELESLDLAGAPVSEAGVGKLQKALPKLRIYF
jgi:Leucine-rich repeat (LRR) protein